MSTPIAALRRTIPTPVLIPAAVAVGLLVAGAVYLSRPAASTVSDSQASGEAKAYVNNLQLSDVTMQATENFMNQQVVEVEGKITNAGSRLLESVDVYCLFAGVDGKLLARERLPIVRSKGAPLRPGEARAFRLPFDSVPEGWNQAMPHMVVAQIAFAR